MTCPRPVPVCQGLIAPVWERRRVGQPDDWHNETATMIEPMLVQIVRAPTSRAAKSARTQRSLRSPPAQRTPTAASILPTQRTPILTDFRATGAASDTTRRGARPRKNASSPPALHCPFPPKPDLSHNTRTAGSTGAPPAAAAGRGSQWRSSPPARKYRQQDSHGLTNGADAPGTHTKSHHSACGRGRPGRYLTHDTPARPRGLGGSAP